MKKYLWIFCLPFVLMFGLWLCSCSSKGVEGPKGDKGDKGDPGEIGEDFYTANPQGLMFYLMDDDTYGVGVGGAGYLSTITIPETYADKKVTTIVEHGFENSSVETLKLPSGIRSIGEYAFANCAKLSSVYCGETEWNLILGETEVLTSVENVSFGTSCFANTDLPSVSFADGDEGSNIKIIVKNNNDLFDAIEYSFALNTETDIVSSGTIENIDKSSVTYEVDAKTYGKFKNSTVKLYKSEKEVASFSPTSAYAVAEEYNFAELNASYPVLVFTLKLKEITKEGTIPTFVNLDRFKTYDWDHLMYNVDRIPTVDRTTAIEGGFHTIKHKMAEYIKELYELNPDSKFNLYCVDNYPEFILKMFVANRIPEENWTATLLSDGVGTAGFYLKNGFGTVDEPMNKYYEMVEEWKRVKEYVYENGYSDDDIFKNFKYTQETYSVLGYYSYVITKLEPNVRWIVNRLRETENLKEINEKDPWLATDIRNTAISEATNTLLENLSDTEQADFKRMYKFSDDMFSVAKEQDKKIMIILGTSWENEGQAFYDYIKMTMEYYGDDYIYYYKGHPGYPTANYTERKEMLDRLNEGDSQIIELDNSIAAEIILFYEPSVYLCGWPTTTFLSVQSPQMACSLFNTTLSAQPSEYGSLMDIYISKIADESSQYQDTDISLDSEKHYYVMEFNPVQQATNGYDKHELAIYCVEDQTITYYKNQGGNTYTTTDK